MTLVSLPLPPPDLPCHTPADCLLDNIRHSLGRGLPEFEPTAETTEREAIVCGAGPSIAGLYGEIRARQEHGAVVYAINGIHRPLVANGVVPNYCVLLDASAEVLAFCGGGDPRMTWLVASQCDPAVFDALSDRRVVVWHAVNSKGVLERHRKIAPGRFAVTGGCTCALRTITLACASGHRRVALYGMDSSFEGEHSHAYDWDVKRQVLDVVNNGRRFRATLGMVQQAQNFLEFAAQHPEVRFDVRGDGLLPCMWHAWRNG